MKQWKKPEIWELDAKSTACTTIPKSGGGCTQVIKPPVCPPSWKWC